MRDLRAEEMIRAEFCTRPLRCGDPRRREVLEEVERLRRCVGVFSLSCQDKVIRLYCDWAIQSLADFGSDSRRGHLLQADGWLGEARTEPAARRDGLADCLRQAQLDVRRLAQSGAFNEYLVR